MSVGESTGLDLVPPVTNKGDGSTILRSFRTGGWMCYIFIVGLRGETMFVVVEVDVPGDCTERNR